MPTTESTPTSSPASTSSRLHAVARSASCSTSSSSGAAMSSIIWSKLVPKRRPTSARTSTPGLPAGRIA
jgi:hypothetical protein